MGPILKVKGHMTEDDVAGDDRLTFYKAGNDLADHYAKLGALAHEKPSPEQSEWFDRALSVSRKVCVLAARLLQLWPACDLSQATRAQKEPVFPVPKACHSWVFTDTFWQCKQCLRVSRRCWPPN
eukprot:7519386-Pyramimonas_sp.AAC.1